MARGVKGSRPICSISGCERLAKAHGWCGKHYKRWLKTGDPSQTKWGTVEERFWRKVDKRPNGCWVWGGATGENGYGRFHDGNGERGKLLMAHRYSYELNVGPIPDGLFIDHLCRNRSCVNPDHIEPVTPKENQHRSPLTSAGKTHCPNGHPYAGANLFCKTCAKANQARYEGRAAQSAS